jgi:hypothetical protein
VALYHFTKDAPLADSSGNKNFLTVEGSDPAMDRGVFGTDGALLNGTTKLHVPLEASKLDLTTNDFTVEGFFIAAADIEDNTSMILLSKADKRDQPTLELRFARVKDAYFLELVTNVVDGNLVIAQSENLGTLPMNSPVYFSLVRRGATVSLGYSERPGMTVRTLIQTDLGSTDARLSPSESPLMIGGGIEENPSYLNFRGTLDEFRISNRALDPSISPTEEFKK